jgi:hypothetical protein
VNKPLDQLVDPKLYLLEERTKTIAFLLGIASVLLCVGIWWGNLMHYQLEIITQNISRETWTILLLGYAVTKLNPNTDHYTNIVACCFGLWLWIYVFLTFVVFDSQPPGVLESMLLLPIILESWELVLNIVNMRLAKRWRHNGSK